MLFHLVPELPLPSLLSLLQPLLFVVYELPETFILLLRYELSLLLNLKEPVKLILLFLNILADVRAQVDTLGEHEWIAQDSEVWSLFAHRALKSWSTASCFQVSEQELINDSCGYLLSH